MDELQKMLSAVQKRAEGYQRWANQVERVLDGQEPQKIGKCSGVGGWLVVGGGVVGSDVCVLFSDEARQQTIHAVQREGSLCS